MPIELREITDRTTWLEWRKDDITASVAAALFGDDLHPHTSAYQLWAQKSGLAPKTSQIDARLARRGHFIEQFAPDLIREERPGWLVAKNHHYYRDPDAHIGATPDLEGRREDIDGPGAIQVKSVGPQAFHRWLDRDTGEVALPPWIMIQANVEAAMMDARWASVVAITIGDAGLDVEIIDVPLVPEVMESFRLHAEEFWRRVREKDPYPINWGKDGALILDMYREDNGSIIDLSHDEDIDGIVSQWEMYKDIEREGTEAEKVRKLYDAQIIQKLGNAAKGRLADGRLVVAETVKRKGYTAKPTSYRAVKVKP